MRYAMCIETYVSSTVSGPRNMGFALFIHFLLSQEYVYKCAIILIIKHEQCQNHSSEIKERPLRPFHFFGKTL